MTGQKELSLILNSGKCSWGKCLACGWGSITVPVDMDKAKRQVEALNLKGIERLKLFCSGSFLDGKQFPKQFRAWLAQQLASKGVKELIVESRPEFATKQSLADLKAESLHITVAIGLECADDAMLKKYNKGFIVKDYVEAAKRLRAAGCGIRTYIMVNIPFGSKEALEKSAKLALENSDSVVLINTFPHSRTELFEMWLRNEWRPLSRPEFDAAVAKWKDNKKVELDFQNFSFVPKFPRERQVLLKGVGKAFLEHPFFNVWQDYFCRFYERPKEQDTALFLPCAFTKPYPKSETHKRIHEVASKTKIYPRIHKVVVSNPGIIPFEFSDFYPFNSYDWPESQETEQVKKDYVEVTKRRCLNYLRAQKYARCLCFLKYTETYAALKAACDELGIKLTNLLDEKTYANIKNEKNPIIQPAALECLRKGLDKV